MDTIISSQQIEVYRPRPLDQNPAAVYLAGLGSDKSRATMREALDDIARLLGSLDCFTCNWSDLRFQHTAAIRARLQETTSSRTGEPYSPATVNKMLCALRGTLKSARQLQQMSAEDYYNARDIKGIKNETLPAGRELQPGEIAALMQACENEPGPGGVRDAAMISLLYVGGLRREEIVNLNIESYDPATGKMVVKGKRRKERTAYLVNGAAWAMADWLEIRGGGPGALFWPINKAGVLTNRRLVTQTVYDMLQKRRAQAGVKDFSPHDLRRTFVSDLLDAGADISTVAKMAGHASVTTTARYDRRPEAAKQKAAGLLHIPYRGRR